jgi:hypothetical protein
LGLFIFGVFLSFGIIAHYCSGARWPTGELFLRNITLWYACPWTLAVAAVQACELGMVALGLARLLASRLTNDLHVGAFERMALWLCVAGPIAVVLLDMPATSSSSRSGQAFITLLILQEKMRGCSHSPFQSRFTSSDQS